MVKGSVSRFGSGLNESVTVFYIQLGEPRSCSRLAGPTELSALPEAIFADGHQVGISWV